MWKDKEYKMWDRETVEDGKTFFLRQCITQWIKAEEDTEMMGKRKENIRSLTMQHTMSGEYHRTEKIES